MAFDVSEKKDKSGLFIGLFVGAAVFIVVFGLFFLFFANPPEKQLNAPEHLRRISELSGTDANMDTIRSHEAYKPLVPDAEPLILTEENLGRDNPFAPF